jgi:opacity protein-like surface antigen
MKRSLMLAFAVVFVFGLAKAQRFDGGILAGFNGTQVDGDAYKGYNKPGALAGFYVQTDLAPAIFAAMELKFNQKGARKNPTSKDPTKYIMRLNYIDMPIYAAFRTNEHGSIIAGIQPGYLLSAKEFNEYGEVPPQDQSEFNQFDLQALIGFQFDLLDQLKADLRFGYSVIHISDNPGDSNYYTKDGWFNNVISLALYYQIGSR